MANKYKTEVGPVMEALHYLPEECERFDALAFKFYMEFQPEVRERIALLIWYLYGADWNNFLLDYSEKYIQEKFAQFNNILAERNK